MCVKSKAVWLILLCSFFVYTGYNCSVLWGSYFMTKNLSLFQNSSSFVSSGTVAVLFLFFPLGGWVGDVRCGRYRTIKCSLLFLIAMLAIPIAVGCVNLVLIEHPTLFIHSGAKLVTMVMLVCLVVTGFIGFIAFLSNIIPFTMDQLRDAPAQELSIFIYWYIWTVNLFILITQLLFPRVSEERSTFFLNFSQSLSIAGACFIAFASIVVLILFLTFYVLLIKQKRWFNTELCRVNPYKLVYKVTKFACQHKRPLHRSAFTYCEDKLPSGLDLGKSKYGGPFTTEEVEDVKVFYEILKVILGFGPLLYLVFLYGDHSKLAFQLQASNSTSYFVSSQLYDVQTIVSIVAIPIYLMLCRCTRLHYLPSFKILTKIELGTALLLLSMLCALAVNIAKTYHIQNEGLSCMFQQSEKYFTPLLVSLIISGEVLVSFSEMLLFISFFEFICAQSPLSMKGMLIGLTYAIEGVFNLLALSLQLPFYHWKYTYPSCGLVYHSINIVIGVASFILFTWVARRYKYRERDEPSRERQFAEEYYSNIQQEPNYDYSISLMT